MSTCECGYKYMMVGSTVGIAYMTCPMCGRTNDEDGNEIQIEPTESK